MSAAALLAAVQECGYDMSKYECHNVVPMDIKPIMPTALPQDWMTGVVVRVPRCPNCFKEVKKDGDLCSDFCRKAFDPFV